MRRRLFANHSADLLPPLLLFFAFALSAVLVVLYGAGIYQNIVSDSAQTDASRTALAYVSEKLHRSDDGSDVRVEVFGDGDALVIAQNISNEIYETWIYRYDGSLCELFLRAGTQADPSFGTRLLAISDFSVEETEDHLFFFSCTDGEGMTSKACASLRSEGGTS